MREVRQMDQKTMGGYGGLEALVGSEREDMMINGAFFCSLNARFRHIYFGKDLRCVSLEDTITIMSISVENFLPKL